MKRLLFGTLFGIVLSGTAWGYSGNQLHRFCDTKPGDIEFAMCTGFVMGVIQSLEGSKKGLNGDTFCPPPKAQVGQLRDVIKNKLRNNPQDRHFSAHSIIVVTLSEIYPCK